MANFVVIPVVLSCLFWPMVAVADYKLSRGDTVGINVFRVPEMSGEVRLDIDGNIAMPPIGNIVADGLSIAELEDQIQRRLSEDQILQDASVTVSLVEVRPVVIGGDVAEPGAVAFEPGMTVRQAIALAGGIGRLRDQARGEAARLRGEQLAFQEELVRAQARLARIDAEISGSIELESEGAPHGGANSEMHAEVFRLEQITAQANRTGAASEQAYYARTRELVSQYIDELIASEERYGTRIAAQREDIARLNDMKDRGLAAQVRVSEENRRLAELVEGQSDIESSMIDARERLERLTFEGDRLGVQREANLISERQETLLAVDTLTARLNSVRGQLLEIGDVQKEEVTLSVFRKGGGIETEMEADGGMQLEPGDFVEVNVALRENGGRGALADLESDR